MPSDPTSSGPATIDIWSWCLDQSFADQADAERLLSEDEHVRAERFLTARDRQRYIVGRAGLRRILSGYLDMPPETIRFTYNSWGKPELVLTTGNKLHFNLSHSAGEALLAVSRDVEIGIDIEEIRPLQEDVASHFFSAAECAELGALAEPDRLTGFYRCWTRKEAFVKGHGAGLSIPLDSFDVSIRETEGQRLLLRMDTDTGSLGDWALLNLHVVDGFCGALATFSAGRDVSVNYRSRLAWSANIASMT